MFHSSIFSWKGRWKYVFDEKWFIIYFHGHAKYLGRKWPKQDPSPKWSQSNFIECQITRIEMSARLCSTLAGKIGKLWKLMRERIGTNIQIRTNGIAIIIRQWRFTIRFSFGHHPCLNNSTWMGPSGKQQTNKYTFSALITYLSYVRMPFRPRISI